MTTQTNTFAMPKFYAELSASGRESMKKMMMSYIDAGERMARSALEWHDKATSWAKNTPWAPMLQMQHDMASQWIDGWIALSRKLCEMGEETARKAEKIAT